METRASAAGMTWTFDAITWPAESYFLLEDLRVLRAVNRLAGYFFVAVFLPVADFFEEASVGDEHVYVRVEVRVEVDEYTAAMENA